MGTAVDQLIDGAHKGLYRALTRELTPDQVEALTPRPHPYEKKVEIIGEIKDGLLKDFRASEEHGLTLGRLMRQSGLTEGEYLELEDQGRALIYRTEILGKVLSLLDAELVALNQQSLSQTYRW